jgi:NhaP-type Na+/H+ or K+/H+ antiporter
VQADSPFNDGTSLVLFQIAVSAAGWSAVWAGFTSPQDHAHL